MARFLVTGGCGFIGSHLVEKLLNQNHQVRVLDNLSTGKIENLAQGVDFVRGDITNRDDVLRSVDGTDGVFHLAAVSSVKRTTIEWPECHAINLTGTINIFDAASRVGRGPVPVVYASSAAVYGDCSALVLCESDGARPISAYGADKLGCELHARIATLLHRVPTVGLRLFNIYGPRQDPTSPYAGVIAIFARRLMQRESIDVFGDGEQLRDFVFVEDAAKFFIAAMTTDHVKGSIFNVCTGRGTSVVELANTLGELCGKKPKINFRPSRAGDIRRSVGNPTWAEHTLKCQTIIDIRDGLAMTLNATSAE